MNKLTALFINAVAGMLPVGKKSTSTKKKILIVRLDGIGDYILFIEFLRGLRDLYPDNDFELTLVGNLLWKDLGEKNPFVDHTVFISRERFRKEAAYRFRALRDIARRSFDIAINPTISREALMGDSIMQASSAAVRIGSIGYGGNISQMGKRISDRWYTELLPLADDAPMELDQQAYFLNKLGLGSHLIRPPRLQIEPEWQKDADRLLEKTGYPPPYVLLSPGVGLPKGKAWPLERFADLSARINAELGVTVLLCGGPGEGILAKKILSSSTGNRIVDLTGETGLGTMAALIAVSEALVAGDTGVVHMASAIGIPSVCVLGGGHMGRFLPYRIGNRLLEKGSSNDGYGTTPPLVVTSVRSCKCDNWNCTRDEWLGGSFPCIDEVDTDQVFDALKRVMANG
ncbi:MAG: glycosyltransferase family 9 protein [Anaerolineales bacterium]